MTEDDVGFSGGEQAMELDHQFGRFLEIRRDDGEMLAVAGAKAGGDRRERTEVATELEELRAQRPGRQVRFQDVQ
jgi:hypothetical protein